VSLLEVGTQAPEFTTTDQDGKTHALSDFQGKKVILYFYPKDNTSGCTTEACAFRDNFAKFRRLNVEILGVSIDSEKSHKAFVQKYDLGLGRKKYVRQKVYGHQPCHLPH
jgi:peroxiredoxin Q/BCP